MTSYSMTHHTFTKNSTNICKGVAIILMYIHHSFYEPSYWSSNPIIFFPFTESQLILIARICKVCVHIFVFLSAYGVYISNKNNTNCYLSTVKRRYLTLLYNFFIVYVLTQLLSPLIGLSRLEVYGDSTFKRIFYTIIDALGLADAFDTPTYNATWWYMSLAFLLILLLPLLADIADKVGYALIPLSILLPLLCRFDMSAPFFHYLFVACLGLIVAKYNVFEYFLNKMYRNSVTFILFTSVILFVIFVCFYCRRQLGYTYLFDGIAAVFICYFCYSIIQMIPLLNKILEFLGIHSMNMFLTHTLIRSNKVRLHDFSYSPRYPVLIIALLLLDTLLLSLIIEYIKKWINKLIKYIP